MAWAKEMGCVAADHTYLHFRKILDGNTPASPDEIKGRIRVISFFHFSKFPVMVLCNFYKNAFS